MDALLTSAASGLRARMESLEMLANNLANQASPGFKTDREYYSLYVAADALDSGDALPGPPTVPVIDRHWTDFSQGALTASGSPLDFALDGDGFFQVRGPAGNLYTRNGHFRLSPSGALVTGEGYGVLATDGRPVRLNPALPVELAPNGDLQQGGAAVARLAVVDFAARSDLAKQEGTYFRLPAGAPAGKPGTATVHQGQLENSNQPPAEAAVRLISVLRQFEMLQRAIQMSGEMNRRVEDVARVGS